MKNSKHGFTLIEIVFVVTIGMTLFGFVMLNLVNVQRITSVDSSNDTLVSDIASQQTKAMQGSGASSGINYGIHFDSTGYKLFTGNVYSASDPNNYAVDLDTGIKFINIKFPGGNLIFASKSGEFVGFVNGNNTVMIQDTQGTKSETIMINKFGVVTSIN